MSPKVYRLFQILIVAAIIILNIVFLGKVPYYGVSNPIYLFFSIGYALVLLLAAFCFGNGKGFFVLVLIYWGILFLSFMLFTAMNPIINAIIKRINSIYLSPQL